jgi:formate-nitrite transporter family protein
MRRQLPFVIIAVVVLVTIGAAAAIYRSKMHPAPQTARTVTPSPSVVEKKQDESLHVRGPRTAPVTIEIYGDFQCPSCGMTAAMLGELEQQYGEQLCVIFHEFPLAMHRHAVKAAMAAEAAGLQGHFWEMHDMLYKYQPVWSHAFDASRLFAGYAKSIGLDANQFETDVKSPELQARIVAEGDAGVARGVKNTPTIFINGREVQGAFRREVLQAAIDAALAEKKKT